MKKKTKAPKPPTAKEVAEMRDELTYLRSELSDAKIALGRYFRGYGESQRQIEQLRGAVSVYNGFLRDPEYPSAWETACAFADYPSGLNQHP